MAPSRLLMSMRPKLGYVNVLKGKIFVLCTLTLANEIQLFPGLGLYPGIFVMYLRCPSNKSRKAIIVFYALSSVTVVSYFGRSRA